MCWKWNKSKGIAKQGKRIVNKTDFVKIKDYIQDIEVELRYATEHNFTGKVIYDFTDAWLRYGTVEKLAAAQEILKKQGYRLKVWDAYRPVYAQFILWNVYPDATFVADPTTGFSDHSRGNTVDVTVIDKDGREIIMPTEFDSFSPLADRDYRDVMDKESVVNAWMLQETMIEAGFIPYRDEWWHFSDKEVYEVEKEFMAKNMKED